MGEIKISSAPSLIFSCFRTPCTPPSTSSCPKNLKKPKGNGFPRLPTNDIDCAHPHFIWCLTKKSPLSVWRKGFSLPFTTSFLYIFTVYKNLTPNFSVIRKICSCEKRVISEKYLIYGKFCKLFFKYSKLRYNSQY